MSDKPVEKPKPIEKPKGVHRYRVHLVGRKPLLMNAMSQDTLDVLYNSKNKKARVDIPKEEKASFALYRENNSIEGVIGIPSVNLLAALRAAGRKVKVGRAQISTASTTTLFSFLDIPQEFIPLTGLATTENGEGWIVDQRRGRLPKDGTAVCLIRPKFMTWELEFEVEIDLDTMTAETVKELFIQAGRTSGLCDFRPSCNGPFGQFTLAALEHIGAVEAELKAAA